MLQAATVLPDHVHALFVLGSRLSVGQTIAKFKNFTRDSGRAPWRWQDDVFEHRLRPDESIDDYGFYLFMNPYRARLLGSESAWPWWQCPDPAVFRFADRLEPGGAPPPAWLEDVETVALRLTTGE